MREDFFTFSEYIKKDQGLLTPSMEDYVEMIYRLSMNNGYARINELSESLNVQPPSVTRMVQKLADLNLVNYERYGKITLTDSGILKGNMLLMRHNIIESFLRSIGVFKGILEETEKIEHTISKETLECIVTYLSFLKENPDIQKKFEIYRKSRVNE